MNNLLYLFFFAGDSWGKVLNEDLRATVENLEEADDADAGEESNNAT
jgi:hypothetical protein